MKFDKQASTVDDQIKLLLARGMVISDPEHAQRCLGTIGYYRLSAYWLRFESAPTKDVTRSKSFRPGTTFEAVLEDYVFDRKLRVLLMEAIERIEIHVRSRWTNRLTLKYGAHAHLNHELFSDGFLHADQLLRLMRSVKQSNETFIKHYNDKYTSPYTPPLWAATELMTMGELSKWIKATLDNNIKDGVARDLGFPTKETFDGTIQTLAYVRNICAHHSRLWNRRMVKRIPKIKRLSALEYEVIKRQEQPTNYLYNKLVVILYLLKQQNTDTTFPARLRELVEQRTNTQREAMGFPQNWRESELWEDV
jgi:abortive infection bacteriophage resistance protein